MRRRMGRPGLVGTMARTAVVAGTATAVVGATSGRKQAQQQQAAAQQQSQEQMAAMQADMTQMQADQAAAAQQAAIDQAVAAQLAAQQPAAAPAAPPADDPMAALQKLADMKQQGLLTDDEFAAMKAKILGV